MKKSNTLFVLSLMLITELTLGQQVTNVSITADNPSYKGACPAKINFTAVIHYTGTGNIQYTWLRSDGAKAPTRTLQLKAGGTQTVTTSWQLGKSFSGWQALKIISPRNYESSHADFTIACNGTAPKTNPNTAVSTSQKNNGSLTTANTHAVNNNATV